MVIPLLDRFLNQPARVRVPHTIYGTAFGALEKPRMVGTIMFKTRWLSFFRKLWTSDSEQTPPKPNQNNKSRLQQLNERKSKTEATPDAVQIKLREAQSKIVQAMLKPAGNDDVAFKGLTHWCVDQPQTRKSKPIPIENRSSKRHTFEIDPRLPAFEKEHEQPAFPVSCAPSLVVTISEATLREMTRLELIKRGQISRSLSGFNDDTSADTLLADKWNCAEYNSLFALPDESRYGTTTEYEEDFEEDLLPYFTETLLLQEEELVGTETQPIIEEQPIKILEAKPVTATQSSTTLQPYKNFSENALKLIAQKPETPAPTLKWLASHTNPHIRAAVAKNPSTPGDTITVLAKDHEAGIRHSIAENPLSAMEALNLLVKDRNPLIAWRAQNTVNQIKEAQKASQTAKEAALLQAQKEPGQLGAKEAKLATTEETIAFLQVIARKTNTPSRRLDELARHCDPRIRAAVAENANAPAEILWILAKDPDSTVKTKVTDNYNCPIEILESMKEDEDAYVAYQAHSVLNRILGATFSDNHLRSATWP